jgi:hypothetical protein
VRARWPSALAVALLVGVAPAALACEQGGAQDDGNSGGTYGGGHSGETDQRGDRNCRNVCGNTIIVPAPAPRG